MEYLENGDQAAVARDAVKADPNPRRNKPANQARDEKLVSDVAEGIASLPTLEREALILSEYEGLGLDEIAAIVGADMRTVAARLESARQRLRNVLANHLYSER
jgi:RNA polymerase sigma factor (sigma-70 family)